MRDTSFCLRKATLRDAKSLAALAEATFRETFAPFNTPGDMDLHCARRHGHAGRGGRGEIQRLYVRREAQGTGLAHILMRACIDEIARRGSDLAWLGVWEKNPRAIAFYRKFGFTEAGDHVFPVGDDPQRDVIMVRPIQRAAGASA